MRKKLFSELYEKVISKEAACIGCGACVLVCPYGRITLQDGRPEQVDGDTSVCPVNEDGKCGLCAEVCPRLHAPAAADGGESVFGPYRRIAAARSTNPVFREKGQDSGLVSAIAEWGIKARRWSGFLGYARDERWRPFPLTAADREGVLQTCGSKYTYITLIDGLSKLRSDLVRSENAAGRYALVGLPCHLTAVRKLRELNSKYVKHIGICIGLFCSKAFTYHGLIEEKLEKEMKISVEEAAKMDIRKGKFTVEMKGGKVYEMPIKELAQYGHSGCRQCTDFAAEQADISAGGLGIGGWTLTVARTQLGEEILDAAAADGAVETAPADDFPKALELLDKLSKLKKGRIKKT